MRTSIASAAALAALLLAGCGEIKPITAPAAGSGNANFSTYAAMGTSITAGWQSGGLVVHHQVHSYAALFAQRAGASAFTGPTISADGIPPLLRIVSLNPLIVSNVGRTLGTPTNLAQPTAYHNLGIAGAVLFDATDSTFYYSGPRSPVPFQLTLRHRGTVLSEAASLSPTFVSVEYGANEVLGPATSGSGNVSFSPAVFEALLHGTLGGLQLLPSAPKLAVFTVPDVTTIPYFTTFPAFTVNLQNGQPIALLGPGDTPLSPGDFVLLNAGADLATGKGFPLNGYNYVNPSAPGTGQGLDDSEVLSASEAASIKTAVDGYNAAIRAEAALAGAAVVDLHGLLQTASTVGLDYQGSIYNADYLTGGLFSLDGVHPNDLAHGFIANAMIDAVNAMYGSSIPRVDLNQAATVTASRLRPTLDRTPRYPVIEGGEAYYRALFPPLGVVPVRAAVAVRR